MTERFSFKDPSCLGRAGHLHGGGCDEMRSGLGSVIRPKRWRSPVCGAVCMPCWERLTIDKVFEQRARSRAAELFGPATAHHLATRLNVTPWQSSVAVVATSAQNDKGDESLGKPGGTMTGACAVLVCAARLLLETVKGAH